MNLKLKKRSSMNKFSKSRLLLVAAAAVILALQPAHVDAQTQFITG